MSVVALIPARYASTRFPGKPLTSILGKPMIQWVYERASLSKQVERVIVATDDERIAEVVRSFGGEVEMTRADHPSGTDRLAEVARRLDASIIVNVQGDEPAIDPQMIDEAVSPLAADASIRMGTLSTPILSREDYLDPNVVKVVTDSRGFALYFSRSPLPFVRGGESLGFEELRRRANPARHIGLYVYRRDFLLELSCLAPTPLESCEQLEQLRVLENGHRIRVVQTQLCSLGVDVPADAAKVEALLRSLGEG